VLEIVTAEATEHPESQPVVSWWSFSKTVLAAASLVLVDRGKLDLDKPVTDAPYTLRHLLQHTSGLPDYGANRDYQRAVAASELPWPIDELLRRVDARNLRFEPGTRYLYSNVGYLFVRQLIERTADADLTDALRTLVFDPLGINGAYVAETTEDFDAIVWGNTRRYDPAWVYHGCIIGSLPSAAACLHRLLYSDLLSPTTRDALLLPRPYDLDVNAPEGSAYGLGVMIEPANHGERFVGHAGSGPGSTLAVFSALMRKRTFGAAVGTDAPDTFPRLVDKLRALV
jgi:D-alanyl-D-alanine carboxypeptidase